MWRRISGPWLAPLWIVALVLLAVPFLVRERFSYYTDGQNLRSPTSAAQKVVRRVLWEPPRPLPPEINHPHRDDYEPRESPDGDLLVFTRGRPGENADLWGAVRVRGHWAVPSPLSHINTDADELGGSFSADGDWLYFYSNRPGGAGGYDLWASPRTEAGWGEAVNLGGTINTPWNEMSPAIDGARGKLYFTSDRRPGRDDESPWQATVRARLSAADYDIYVAENVGDVATDFDPAVALTRVNRRRWAEGAVAVSPAGDFLYFSSNRPGGEGGFDLYRLRLSGADPGPPESLGAAVNTAADELDPALASSGFRLYFCRSEGGQEDLFVTHSREVYVDTEVGRPIWSLAAIAEFLAALVRRIPPSILLILVFFLAAALVLLLLKTVLRNRWGTLNVLTRCFLFAVFVHLLMAIWMNRNEVSRLVLKAFDAHEPVDAFQVTVEGLAEEDVGLAIREALATTERDAPRVLAVRTPKLRPPTQAPSPPPLVRPLSPAASAASSVRFDPAPLSQPAAAALDDSEHSVALPPPAREFSPPEIARRRVEALPVEVESPSRELLVPVVPGRRAPRRDAERVVAPAVDLRRSAARSTAPLDRQLSAPRLPAPAVEPVRVVDIPVDIRLPESDDSSDGLLAEVAGERAVERPLLRSAPRAGLEDREEIRVTRRRRTSETSGPPPGATALSLMTPAEPAVTGLAAPRWSPPPRPSTSAVGGFEPPAPTELRPATVAASRAPASSFVPQIYRLREKSRRQEVLEASGGSEATENAVQSGLRWLALHQSPDGRWRLDDYAAHLDGPSSRDLLHRSWDGQRVRDSRGGRDRAANGDTAATGLALLAFFGHGDTHLEDGPYRLTTERGLEWLLAAQKANGDLRGGGNLYMHAVAAFALCEAYAFTRDERLRRAAQRAIDFTVRTQHPQKGGWRYQPYPASSDVDTSVFGWMLMALKSGRLGGLRVDERALSRAAAYLDSVRLTGRGGRYAYQPGKTRTSLAMTAQGFFCHQMLVDSLLGGEETSRARRRAADEESISYLLSNLPRAADMEGVNFYYWYYSTLALFQEGGRAWEIWNRRLSELLVRLQVGEEHGTAHGSWDPRGKRARTGGRVYSTALSVLCLEAYYRYAPLRERTSE